MYLGCLDLYFGVWTCIWACGLLFCVSGLVFCAFKYAYEHIPCVKSDCTAIYDKKQICSGIFGVWDFSRIFPIYRPCVEPCVGPVWSPIPWVQPARVSCELAAQSLPRHTTLWVVRAVDSSGTIWGHMGSIWIHMGPIWSPIWNHMEPIWNHMGPMWVPYGLIWIPYGSHMDPYGPNVGPIWTHMDPIWVPWSHMGPTWAPYGVPYGVPEPIWDHMGPYRPHMGPYPAIWVFPLMPMLFARVHV